MYPPNSVRLPSDAVKAILTFMTREELINLSVLNRQFASLVQSPPSTAKPLLRLVRATVWPSYCAQCRFYDCTHVDRENATAKFYLLNPGRLFGCTFHEVDDLDSMLYRKWLRIEEFIILLPREIEVGREWFESLHANSHCLNGCKSLFVAHYDETLPPGCMELVDKLRPMVDRVSVHLWYDG